MTPERWQQIENIVQRLAELSEDQQADAVAAACGSDQELRDEVESLLKAYNKAGPFLESPALNTELDAVLADLDSYWIGRQIGSYTLVRRLGDGGMCSVFLAERADDEYQGKVAIKLIRYGMESSNLRRRFHNERQILALLDNPNIARLLDGGTTDAGLPYIVMEYIEGVAIDVYCEQECLSLEKRLEIFGTVCKAVQHAHQNLIIHRDIKPANVLVTKRGHPKLVDFGIAKLLDPQSFPYAVATTKTAAQPMTPGYASPEQILGETITTATDVYSLGVVLFKILTGTLPYPSPKPGQALSEVILRAQPIKPSLAVVHPRDEPRQIRLSSPALGRPVSRRQWRRRLEGDLDTIVLKALHHDPRRRYGSAEQLADDLHRYLEGRPVSARRDGLLYRAGKLVQRNKLLAVGVVGFMILSSASAVFMSHQALQLAEQRDHAQREREQANRVATFVVDLFDVVDDKGGTITARELLERATGNFPAASEIQPEHHAILLTTLGKLYGKLGAHDRAHELLTSALDEARRFLSPGHPNLLASLYELSLTQSDLGDYQVSEETVRMLLAQAPQDKENLLRADGKHHLAWLMSLRGESEDAESLYKEALVLRQAMLGPEHPLVAKSLRALGTLHYHRGERDLAERFYRDALRIYRQDSDPKSLPDRAVALESLASTLRAISQFEEAESLARESLAIHLELYGDQHPVYAATLVELALNKLYQGEPAAADPLLREALAQHRRFFGDQHPRTAWNMALLGSSSHDQGKIDDAETYYRQSIEILREKLPKGFLLAMPLIGWGRLQVQLGKAREAEPMLREALALRMQSMPESSLLVARAEIALGECLTSLQDHDSAAAFLTRGYRKISSQPGHETWKRDALRSLVRVYESRGLDEEARVYRQLLQAAPPEPNP